MSAERNSFQVSVYVDTRLGDRELAAHVAQTLRGSFTGARADIVHAERIDLEVTQNDERFLAAASLPHPGSSRRRTIGNEALTAGL